MKAKINPLEQLIEIYGEKFATALKAGDLNKAIRMCADYQSPDTGRTLDFADRVKAFAFRVSMEACKVPEIGPDAVRIEFTDEQFLPFRADRDIGMEMTMDQRFYQTGEFKLYGITLKRVFK